MRIDWLEISDFKNFKNFRIDFDEDQPITVLLGHNGLGKSNLFEAIIDIFRNLENLKPTSFKYSICYYCYNVPIIVKSDPESKPPLSITIDNYKINLRKFKLKKDFYLPAYVFGYYSGWNGRLEQQFDEITRNFCLSLKNTKQKKILIKSIKLRDFFTQGKSIVS